MNDSPVKTQLVRDKRLLTVTMARPKANIIDTAMITAIREHLDKQAQNNSLSALVLQAEGPNFSFGASVEEHLPGQCKKMLHGLHSLILTLLEYPVPILVAVRGYCLGGGLELACAGHRIFATPDAHFGQPEIQLAVFAPVASCLLPERIHHAHAEELLLSGRTIDAEEALQMNLINSISANPELAAMDYFDNYLAKHSSYALRHALWAARHAMIARVKEKLAAVEKRYLEELMSSHDAVEGLTAFMEKRPAKWENR